MTIDPHWMIDPPWGPQPGDISEARTCVRCGWTIAPNHRHYWPPCRDCRIWSFLGAQVFTWMGFPDAREWLYFGGRPWCTSCEGTGWLSCEDQDMSVLRRSGACTTCGAYSMVLVRTVEPFGEIEGSGRHYDDVADHEVTVGAMPLVPALNEALDRNTEPIDPSEVP